MSLRRGRDESYAQPVFSGRIVHAMVRSLDRFTPASDPDQQAPAHQLIGRRGEEDAYFYLRRRGYVIVARNYRTARHRGEIDLIGWDKDVLCFIEVKSRTTRDVKPAEAAVDRKKRHDLRAVIRDYLRTLPLRQFPEPPPWRFDVVSVNYETEESISAVSSIPLRRPSGKKEPPRIRDHRAFRTTFELFQNAALSS